ncbi:hypothetical protein RhiirA5_424869 [Rhizophagus irregularis]|uniref:Uncharacterized protein n=1 Tax=Rhizophagus irregularis TaxID=588596 RepID=A0A2N0P7H8_9GLOM|nr:hypothetical protein RhiirA5_424869 [Rhizophagus irregularis]
MYNLRTNKLEIVFYQRAESAAITFGLKNLAITISKYNSLLAYLNFINNNESLFIIAQEKENLIPLIIVWDLFGYMDNSIRILNDTTRLFSSENYKLVRSYKNIIFVSSDGSVTSVLEHTLIKDMFIPAIKLKKRLDIL